MNATDPTRHATRIAALAAAALVAASLSGCAFLAPRHTFDDTASIDQSIAHVVLDSRNGNVTVRGVDGVDSVSLERTVTYRGAEREIGDTHRVSGDELVLGDCGRNCSVDYVLEVPAGVEVSGSTTNGAIELVRVSKVDVETNNGRIELDRVTGSITATTSNGKIVGQGLAGTEPIVVETSNGAIELEFDEPRDVQATTSNGAIDLRVPDAAYRVETETSNGGTAVGVVDDPDGEFTLELRTSNGSITVEPRG
ncbi:DUF4097 family beta strand repeat-containing protein [Agromyces larvae]|uniref:DUF4097 family beta strand repeat-containing protein n=1 Tax=Agromyces larvae TaxID=2929802 RepID=A0ABY4BWR2_9MICO|nr:DUF4097 family beta strand repeat-containing protein [Agromyces larvae]UOE43635.1 DUF4097 family beta strand repeat-containing protein [Agromyces larvae]